MRISAFLSSLFLLSIVLSNQGCRSSETSSNVNEDSVRLAMMQARLDSMEQALANKTDQLNNGELSSGANQGGGQNAGTEIVTSYKPNKNYKEPLKKVPKAGNNFFAKDMGNYPEGSNRLLTQKDIQHISSWGYRLMLNEIYARHGMSFTDKNLQDHFNNQSWYKTGRKNVDKSLSAIEKQNIEFLKNNQK